MSALHTILQRIQRLFKCEDEPSPVKERYPLDFKEALQSQFEKGRQSVLKEQVGLGGIHVLDALQRKYQAGLAAGMRLGSRCNKGHPLGELREQSPGVFVLTCETCSKVERRGTQVLNLPIGAWTRIWHQSPEKTQVLPTIPKKTDAP